MDANLLQKMASEIFRSIEFNTKLSFPHSTLKESFDSFNVITTNHGLVWLIDAASGTDMSHLSWCRWMSEARSLLSKQEAY